MASGDPPNTDLAKGDGSGKKISQKEQSERFKKTARELGVDESGEKFDLVFDRIITRPAS